METKEIRIKAESELNHLLADSRKKLDEMMFRARQKQLKNIREIRIVRKDIAKILTILKEKKNK